MDVVSSCHCAICRSDLGRIVSELIFIKVAVAGSRDFQDYDLLKKVLNHELSEYASEEVEIVSGGAVGADSLGERYQKEYGCALKRFLPDWDRFGDSAGHRRNADMAYYADWVICFWDGQSKGTKGMIETSKRAGKKVIVVKYQTMHSEKEKISL